MYYIDKEFLGLEPSTKCRMLCEDGTLNPGTVGAFLQIAHVKNNFIPSEIINTLSVCNIPIHKAGLSYLVRKQELNDILELHKRNVDIAIGVMGEYIKIYSDNIHTLNSCSPCRFLTTVEDIDITPEGFADPVKYNTVTKTGRMSVVSGPSFLTMKKDTKSKIISRFQNGKIIEIDFSALEPRTALAIAGSEFAESDDVYAVVGDILGINSRPVAKQATISFLYGANITTISKLIDMPLKSLRPKLNYLKQIFKYDEIISKIHAELKANAYFKNHFGRVIFPDSNRDGVLFNNFCQSSAVDVALSGFASLLKQIKDKNMNTCNVCFIHDAVLLDVPESEIEALKLMATKLPTRLGINFPVKLKIVDN